MTIPDGSLIHLDGLTKPATTFIEKISDAVGGVFKPFQIVRVAKAEAEADQIRAESQIQVTDLHRRAMRRFFEEESKRQSNIESITQKALPLLQEESTPQGMDDDWITNFFDKCRIVSDEDMQRLWSRVLAAEANAPRTFSRRTVNLLADLEKFDAEIFTTLCGFGWAIGDFSPLVFEHGEPYSNYQINFDTLTHLEALGLVRTADFHNFIKSELPKKLTVSYFGTPVELTLPKEEQNQLPIGMVILTRAGRDLASVCSPKPVEGFLEFVREKWKAYGLIAEAECGIRNLA